MRLSSPRYAAAALTACLAVSSCGAVVERTDGEPGSKGAVASGLEAPPEGHRWVGDRGVIVAVPDWWTTGDTECLLPVEDTVYAESGAMTDCESTVPDDTHREVSSLAVIATGSAHGGRIIEDLSPDDEVGGESVLTGEECYWSTLFGCRTVVAVPSRGVAFALHVADGGDIDPAVIRDSLTLLREGWTTVPLSFDADYTPTWGAEPAMVRKYADLLERDGLTVRIEEAQPPGDEISMDHHASFPKGTLLGIEPTPGSPIEEGGEVVLTVMPATEH